VKQANIKKPLFNINYVLIAEVNFAYTKEINMVDTAVFVQAALDMTQVDEESNGQWRIYSKRGAGVANLNRGDIVNNAYACIPIAITSYDGVEFTLSVRGSISFDISLVKTQGQVRGAVEEVVQAIMKGQI